MNKQENREKNILILVPSIGGGGAEHVACRLANELCKKYNLYLMYYDHKDKTYFLDSKVNIIDFFVRPDDRWFGRFKKIYRVYALLFQIVKVIQAKYIFRIDTSVSFMAVSSLVNVLAPGKCRTVISERNDPSCKSKCHCLSSLIAHKLADYAVFQNRKVQNMYGEKVRTKSSIIPNPTEVSCFVSEHRLKKIAAVGRLHEQKNHKLLISAFSLFHKTHLEYHLYIYGEGPLLNELKQHAETCGVKDNVHFEGFREDVHAAIADAEQFVLSSDYEGLSNALMEAMMMGHACISTCCTGSDELIEDGKNGLLVPVGDVHAMCEAMCRLSDSVELRKKLGHAAACTAEAWNIDKITRLWEKVL